MSINKEFLDAYSRFEGVLRDTGIDSVRDYEESIAKTNPSKSAKIKISRLLRNYLVHEGEDFVEATPAMIEFVKEQTEEFGGKNETPLKKSCVKLVLKAKDPLKTAASEMLKKKVSSAPVFDDKGAIIGKISFQTLAKMVAAGKTSGKLSDAPLDKCMVTEMIETATLGDALNALKINPKISFVYVTDKKNSIIGFVYGGL